MHRMSGSTCRDADSHVSELDSRRHDYVRTNQNRMPAIEKRKVSYPFCARYGASQIYNIFFITKFPLEQPLSIRLWCCVGMQ